ncbi:hypothetical protein CVT24_008095 [Panaeolus cyanescens]|uniref:BTB domain-containing protein n=1 Tax=Panaeolus cyanescens TaxID=181874 RepID=A0A409YLE4_9AGAR|nr:hypothetical protein CVT24_008095 [Panaeolus cyanescens]
MSDLQASEELILAVKKRKLSGDSQDEMDVSGPDTNKMKRSFRFWFHDGNVVLQTEDKQFRVHRSLLALHSKVFADMFSIPQPVQDPSSSASVSGSGLTTTDGLNEMVEGCPVVRIYDDSSDISVLLSVLYGLDTVRDYDVENHALELISLLKVGQKYEFGKILQDVLKELRQRFPISLEEFEKHQPFPFNDGIFALVEAAHQFHLHSILPALYANLFHICSTEEIQEQLGIFRGGPPATPNLVMSTRTLVHVLMSAQRYHLAIVKFHLPAFKTRGPSGECNTPSICCSSFPTTLDYAENPASPFNLAGTPFPDKEGTLLFSPHKPLCDKCRALVLPRYVGRRRNLWLDLPRLFGYDAQVYKDGGVSDFMPVEFKMA